jgi:DNA-binding transcriptional ArsR family regulator
MSDADRVLQALGDPTRRAIFDRLAQGPVSISGLAEPLGVTVTAVAQHVAVLEACGLARSQKVGRVRTCALATEGLDVLARWIETKRPALDRALDRLGDLLDEDN